MKTYSEDLRKSIIEAVDRGIGKNEAARTFGVSLSSVNPYVGMARKVISLTPKKRPGLRPKIDEQGKRLLEAGLEKRPAATLPQRREYLQKVARISVSESTVTRMLKRLGWSQKKIAGCRRAGGVLEGGLVVDGR